MVGSFRIFPRSAHGTVSHAMWSSRRLRIASLATLVLAAHHVTAGAASYRVNGWYPCSYSTENEDVDSSSFESMAVFDCAEIEVPLCYEGVCESDRKINFFVKRLVAEDAPADVPRKAMIVMQGGPGEPGTTMEGVMDSMKAILGDTVDYYTFDHRGTGRSEFLQCDAAQALTGGSPGGQYLTLEELDSCFQDLNFQYDDQAAAFSTTSAALDVKALIDTFLADDEVFVAGYSYGTYLAQRILQLEIPQVVGYIFDGVDALTTKEDPLESANSHWNQAIHAPGHRLLEFCFDDPECFFEFSSRETVLEDALAFMLKLEKEVATNKCAKAIAECSHLSQPSAALRDYMSTKVRSYGERVHALNVLSSAQRCDKDDLEVIEKAFGGDRRRRALKVGRRSDGGTPDVLEDGSSLTYNVIVFSERWSQPGPTKAERDLFFLNGVFSSEDSGAALEYCAFTRRDEPACHELYDQLPEGNGTFVYEHDQIMTRPLVLPQHAGALIINGGLDFQTPQEFGELLYEKLDGGGKGVVMVNFDYGTHCDGEAVDENQTTPCRDSITAQFVKHGGDVTKIDTKCMKKLPTTHFG